MKGRPQKPRVIGIAPRVVKFSPRGPRGRPNTVFLRIDQAEAVRLADLERMSHARAAAEMRVSRQTFDRILKKARFTIADAIINGKIIEIRA